MQPRSDLFDQVVAGPHTVVVSADVLSKGKVIASGLPVASGSVTGSRSQFARRTCSVVIGDPAYKPTGLPATATVGSAEDDYTAPVAGVEPGPTVFPSTGVFPLAGSAGGWVTTYSSSSVPVPANLLAPFGNEIRLWRGALTPVGVELICVGTFGIRSAEFDHGPAFKGVTVTGVDRCKRLAEARFVAPRTSVYSGSAVAQIVTLIREVIPYADVRIDPGVVDATIPQVTWASDRDKALTDLVTAIGCELFADPLGGFVVQPVPSPTDPVVYTVAGGAGGVLVSAQRSMTRDGVYNGVVARGQSTGTDEPAPTSQLIVDADPTSATYWYGPFGQVPGFYDSSLLVSTAQADMAARALLANNLGLPLSVNFGAAVHPAVEPGDVVAVVNPDSGFAEQHILDQLTVPLDVGGVMTASTRSTITTLDKVGPAYAGSLS